MIGVRYIHRRRVGGVAAGLAVTLLVLVASASASAASVPVWRATQANVPTVFTQGATPPAFGDAKTAAPLLAIRISNIGAVSSSGSVTVTDALPEGLEPAPETPAQLQYATPGEETEIINCPVPVGQLVKCVLSEESVTPGSVFTVSIPVVVSATAPSHVVNHLSVSGGGAAPFESALEVAIAPSETVPAFGFLPGASGLFGAAFNEDGSAAVQAGSHPAGMLLEAGFPGRQIPGEKRGNNLTAVEAPRNLDFELPAGMVVNPRATPIRCTEAGLISKSSGKGCPPATQIGQLVFLANLGGVAPVGVSLYNMVPPDGVPAELGFILEGAAIHVLGGLSGNFHISSESREIIAKLPLFSVTAELWGIPSAASHDYHRRGLGCLPGPEGGLVEGRCPVTRTETPLLTMPTSCGNPLELSATASSWQNPASLVSSSGVFTDLSGAPVAVRGCEALHFSPEIAINATSRAAESPTGLDVRLELPQNEGARGLASANLKKVTVRLPQGVAVNPSAADGLAACSPGQIGIGNNLPASCPSGSKVGTVEIVTPLLESPLTGSIYLAEQGNNPFGTLLALYIVVEGEGIVVKLPGRVDADATTGQLTATFDNNPDLPFSDLKVHFNSGSRAPLVTPPSCGTYSIQTELSSWASEAPVIVNSPMSITEGCGGGFSPELQAGTENPVAGAFSPFTLRIIRRDGEQNISRISATLPQGLLAKLAGVPLCPESQTATGSCGSASQVGTTTVGTGAGSQPLYIPQAGKEPTAVYLAGPYKGGPYSLVTKVPAQAGPFDLGTVAVRVALSVDPFTTQVTASSDPLPQILEGIPISYRDVRVNANRANFVLNPTSCEPKSITSELVSAAGRQASPNSRFQVGGCERLGFKPSLSISVKGATQRAGHPALKAVVTYPKKGSYANIARAQVGLPHSEFLDQGNLNKVCTQPELRSDTCPKKAIYGHAKAWTPLLDRPLEGPVYLGVGFGYKLPALVADLNGQVRILLKGKVDTTKQGGIRNTFEAVPDAPVSRFVLEMKGGKKYGLLENSENICRRPQLASATFKAQNGKLLNLQPKIHTSCKGKKKTGQK